MIFVRWWNIFFFVFFFSFLFFLLFLFFFCDVVVIVAVVVFGIQFGLALAYISINFLLLNLIAFLIISWISWVIICWLHYLHLINILNKTEMRRIMEFMIFSGRLSRDLHGKMHGYFGISRKLVCVFLFFFFGIHRVLGLLEFQNGVGYTRYSSRNATREWTRKWTISCLDEYWKWSLCDLWRTAGHRAFQPEVSLQLYQLKLSITKVTIKNE